MVWTNGEGFEDEVIEAPIGTGIVGEAALSARLINCGTGGSCTRLVALME